jgi:shikimate dehydrogenase
MRGDQMNDLYGVIGHPVGHSMSPLMHNKAFEELNLSASYHAFDVAPDRLMEAVRGLQALGFRGFNVTIPHKVNIMSALDEIDEEARVVGAVNTVKSENGMLIGFNTDGLGFLRSLEAKLDGSLSSQKVLIIGAGGASRGITTTLARHGAAAISIANRTLSKAEVIQKHCEPYANVNIMSIEEAEQTINLYDIVINTTSVGMSPNDNEIPLKLDLLKFGAVVSDIIYNPFKTLWLQHAENKGAIIDNGVPMFVHQGELAFEIWTGIKPNVKIMTEAVIKQLGGR